MQLLGESFEAFVQRKLSTHELRNLHRYMCQLAAQGTKYPVADHEAMEHAGLCTDAFREYCDELFVEGIDYRRYQTGMYMTARAFEELMLCADTCRARLYNELQDELVSLRLRYVPLAAMVAATQ